MAELREERRENWGSRPAFVLAAIGSAVGLGNLWGFPYKLYSYGGGAFLIPYIIAMVLVGVPLLIAEFSLGHLTQRATPEAFGRAHRRSAFVGWWQIILSFVIITYYAVILAWCLSFLYYSIEGIVKGGLPWAGQGLEGVQKAKDFFRKDYLQFNGGFSLGQLRGPIVVSLVVTWAVMYLCIFRGVRLVGKVVMWTVPLPWLMLLILTIRGLTLDGAVRGLEYYLEPNWSRLADPTTWRWAFGQMFFSMSLAFGIMITYASFLHRKSDLNNNAAITGLADVGTSFVAGLAVFATLGGMAYASAMAGAAVPVEKVAAAGPDLTFVAFPYALAQLPYAAYFSAVFFTSLLLLGIDSAFSITESVLASIVDKTGWNRGKTLIGLSIVGLATGLLFSTQGGLSWLGSFDGFINGTWGITLTALLECLVLGWLFRLRRLRRHANERSDWKIGPWWEWLVRLVIPVILAALFAWSLFDGLADPAGYAYKYEPDEVTVHVPAAAADALPARPVLELHFVAAFSGEAAHKFNLDETKAEKTAKGWKVVGGDGPEAVAEGFTAADLAGRPLTFTTKSVSARTAYKLRYRWASLPAKDPKTGEFKPVPEKAQPKWTSLGELTTHSRKAGINTGNTAGLCLMVVAPILAIVIASVRFRRNRQDEAVAAAPPEQAPRITAAGTLAAAVSGIGLGLMARAFMEMLWVSEVVRLAQPLAAGAESLIVVLLVLGGLAALVALLLGGTTVLRHQRRGGSAHAASQLAASLGVVGLGICGGLALAFTTLKMRFAVKPMTYDHQLSGTSYLVLGGMLGLIVLGLLWCFYRAIRAAGPEPGEAQLSEGNQSN